MSTKTKEITYYKLFDGRSKWVAVEYNQEDTEARIVDHPTWSFEKFTATVPNNYNNSKEN